jgi:hypothetical protein
VNDYEVAKNQVEERWDQQMRMAAHPAHLRYVVDLSNARMYLQRAIQDAFMAGANWGLQRNTQPIKIYVDHVGGDTSADEVRKDRG